MQMHVPVSLNGLNHDLNASFFVLKPSACQNNGLRNVRAMHYWPESYICSSRPVHTMQGHTIRSAHILHLAVPTFNVSIVFHTV